MRDIKLIKTTQINIFPTDDIDFIATSNDSSLKKIESNFVLKPLQMSSLPIQMQQPIILQNGEFNHKGKIYSIEQLVIEQRKIHFSIFANSDISNSFLEELLVLLKSFDTRESIGKYIPLIQTYETVCILPLNIKIEHLITNFDSDKINSIISKNNSNGAKISIVPSSIKFQIKYNNIPDKLNNNKITIADKALVIELRDMSDPKDQIYYTVSPTDFKTHMQLLESIEELHKKK
ncbi:MAG TPA: hypothetical protein PLC67_04975 [Spirochaetota bacterium]|nr:hypothetical protein [Spirochaetota bacterium]HPA63285.1 hypothetical protein [Spirochaetota bacterium]